MRFEQRKSKQGRSFLPFAKGGDLKKHTIGEGESWDIKGGVEHGGGGGR